MAGSTRPSHLAFGPRLRSRNSTRPPKRLDLLASELNAAQTPAGDVDGELLDTMFTSRLAPHLASELLSGERRTHKARLLLVIGGVVALVLLAGLVAFLLLQQDGLMFQPVPSRCSIECAATRRAR
jgi:hypothetical protein